MKAVAHDTSFGPGLAYSVLAALSFGLSGTLATPLMAAGWSPAAVVVVRVLIGGVALALPAAFALRGRWHLLREEAALVASYGVVCIGFTQFAYFSAVTHMEVGIALLIEYAAPVVVLGWLWLRDGQRPSRTTALGALIAVAGLVLVLDLFSGASVSLPGLAWGFGAMLGCAVYFVLSARPAALPGVVLASGGMLLGGALLGLAGLAGLVPLHAGAGSVAFRGVAVAAWLVLLAIGVVTCGLAYLFGILGSRRLGSRLASFVALLEVVVALAMARLLLGQAVGPVQLVGGLGILAGVVLVRLGEPARRPEPLADVDQLVHV
ncbi:membrane protein [Nocardioides phosphati]|uniref:Membrane protein n=1 Tax=Nocardioides phosphati TaxID=1867775 RepID=A0ABQ2N656_9ACTN|nr:DMT family transporter [Nocardioides phosphati]GGO85886.1 membrane protein [Nocardioides phosphati]